MASFPTSVFSPSARSNGQTIDASHVNDLQDEVTAIEDGFRNATAPLNSSRSTVAALSVTGASTFAARPTMPPPDIARVSIVTVQNLTNNVATAIAWTKQDVLTNSSMHSTVTNNSLFTPQSTGVYVMSVCGYLSLGLGAATGSMSLALEDSSGFTVGISVVAGVTEVSPGVTVVGVKRFDVTGGSLRAVATVRGGTTNSLSTGPTHAAVYKL